jgi:hypothetical protein
MILFDQVLDGDTSVMREKGERAVVSEYENM